MHDLRYLFSLNKPFSKSRQGYSVKRWQSTLLCLLLALPGGLVLAGDEAYTWKDAAGRVHYGNRPPEGQAATPIPVQPSDRIYTWTDAEGKVQYGAYPPPDVVAKELKEDDSSLSTIHAGKLREGEKQLLRESQQRQ
ncbi:MAG: DUF4124 domain-containing protein [Gammaproteobacteria bacterium]|nr:DUF4124 domain-containing protein [Gammaproteobacteria bacterium]MCP5198006.1 DUF4124 domain-containing protein [Gammaproteobacteria bacterium]